MNQENNVTRRLVIGLVVGGVFGLGLGLLIGLVFAYVIAPLEWTDAAPQDLREDYAAYYWEMVAESYGKHGSLELAQKQLGEWSDETREIALSRARIESSPELQMILDSLGKKVAGQAAAGEAPVAEEEPADAGLLSPLLVVLLFVLVLAAISLLIVRMRKSREQLPAPRAVEEGPPEWLATMHPEERAPSAPALGHFVTSYALGNDTYDESFSIETSAGEFLGECGVGISETIGVGDPDKVTAFEVWLFDKNDIRTVTQVLMSEHAYNDPDLRAGLASKGEPVHAQVSQPMVLETATLRLEVMITEQIYGTAALPPNSFFERLTLELVTRSKEPEEGGLPGV
ncbi:MAG: hypothetical protein ISS56_00865 [Anaerolineae bacterium]|nr:hypothetical protein [Anaerolineae bacterium]